VRVAIKWVLTVLLVPNSITGQDP
jgi:hypothetical protein